MMEESKHQKWMQMAIDKAKEGVQHGQTPFGACIVRGDQLISCEHNRVWETIDITAHAEIVAIRAACQKLKTIDLSGMILYSTCEPCPMCFSAIHWAKIKKLYYGATIEDAKKFGFLELEIAARDMKAQGKSPVEITSHFLIEEARSLFAHPLPERLY